MSTVDLVAVKLERKIRMVMIVGQKQCQRSINRPRKKGRMNERMNGKGRQKSEI